MRRASSILNALSPEGRAAARAASAARAKTNVSIAYVDSGLVSDVKAGENKGVRMTHDHVVRALKSALASEAPFSTRFRR